MASYISSNANRFYTALESSYGQAGSITALSRIPALKLTVQQQLDMKDRKDKTGSRTFAGLPAGGRKRTNFELRTYLTSWDKTSAGPGYGPLFQASLGGTPEHFGGGTGASSTGAGTGADGRFAFTGLSRGKYSLMAAAHGFMLQGFERHDMYATAIVAGPDLDSEHLVFRLQPDASVEGQVTDENNDSVQNAMVRLFEQSKEDGRQRTIPTNQGQADDQGHFYIGHLPPGTYYLAVSARPWYAQNSRVILRWRSNNPDAEARAAQEAAVLDVTYALTFYPDSVDSAGASPIVLHPGERVAADVLMRAVPSLHLRIRTSNSGSAGMVGFPRVSQRIFDGYLDSVFNASESSIEPGIVDIAGLAPGHYVIEMPTSKAANDKGANREGYREVDLTGDLEVNANDSSGFVAVAGSVLFEGAPPEPKGLAMQLSR